MKRILAVLAAFGLLGVSAARAEISAKEAATIVHNHTYSQPVTGASVLIGPKLHGTRARTITTTASHHLVAHYNPFGGTYVFWVDRATGKIDRQSENLVPLAVKKVQSELAASGTPYAIVLNGPVDQQAWTTRSMRHLRIGVILRQRAKPFAAFAQRLVDISSGTIGEVRVESVSVN